MRNPCFMGCEPRDGEDETFFVYVVADMTSYGHTVDAHTLRAYPEDWPSTLAVREEGRDFGCWHSKFCPDGELTTFDPSDCRKITRQEFEQADEAMWPTITDELTSAAPAMAIYVLDPHHLSPVKVWDSVEGDT
jgi:hypothetical protein